MKLADFTIGEDFWMSGRRWRCLDLATAHVLAAEVTPAREADPGWFSGPPYVVGLHVLDAYDIVVCFKTKEAWEAAQND